MALPPTTRAMPLTMSPACISSQGMGERIGIWGLAQMESLSLTRRCKGDRYIDGQESRWPRGGEIHVVPTFPRRYLRSFSPTLPLKLKARKNFNLLPVRHTEASHCRVCHTTSLGTLRDVNSYIKTGQLVERETGRRGLLRRMRVLVCLLPSKDRPRTHYGDRMKRDSVML
jgi:hypothetical protein